MEPYEQEKMQRIRSTLERDLFRWPGVTTKVLFGNPAYVVNGRIFAILVTGGIVLTRLDNTEGEAVSLLFRTFPVTGRSGAVIKSWIGVNVCTPDELSSVIPFVKRCYERAATNQK